jgi:glucose/arabinose dehydrogenase
MLASWRISVALGVCFLGGAAMFDAASAQPFNTKAGPNQAQMLVPLEHPWKIAVLPNERLLITEKPGRFALASLSASTSACGSAT